MSNLFDTIRAGEPDEIVSGDLVQWRRDDLDYSNSAYTLQYRARFGKDADVSLSFDATADGLGFLVSLPSATTEKWVPGEYPYQILIQRNSDSERIRIGSGTFTVVGDFDDGSGEVRTHAKLMLDRIEALLEGRALDTVDNYSIGNRSLTKMSVSELTSWRSYYLSEVESEEQIARARQGKKGGNSFQIRFGGNS
jgi:hypothetical protein